MTSKKRISQANEKKSKAMEYVEDSVITAKVKAALVADDFFKSLGISVKTNDGIVLLMGEVPSQGSITKIKEIVAGVKGVKKIIANLEIVE